jgi:DNA repair protein RecO (recombination protein O)
MPLVATEAIVLHAFNYSESSRIVRLATREAGLVAVMARGARRPKSALGTLDLFMHGVAQISLKPQRDLHNLTAFDLSKSRTSLGKSLPRFTAASMLAELVLRFGHEESARDLFDPLAAGLDILECDVESDATDVALRAAWQLVAALGFSPAVDDCANCHAPIDVEKAAVFDMRAGGALCGNCAAVAAGRRTLPSDARDALRTWLAGEPAGLEDQPTRKAHRRLLREFLAEHLHDGGKRALTAFAAWDNLADGAA